MTLQFSSFRRGGRCAAGWVLVVLSACGEATPGASPDKEGAAAGPDTVTVDARTPASQTGAEMFDIGVTADSLDDRDQFIIFGLRRVGATYDELVDALGSPDSVRSAPFENMHIPGQIDSTVIAHFKLARVMLYRRAGAPDIISNITVFDNSLLNLPTLTVGMDWHKAESVLGAPQFTDDLGYRWSCTKCVVDQQVVLRVEGGKVTSIGFAYYVD